MNPEDYFKMNFSQRRTFWYVIDLHTSYYAFSSTYMGRKGMGL